MIRSAILFFMLFVSALTVTATQLTGSFAPLPSGSNVNLSAEGTLDWAHWGLTSATDFNHLATTNHYISNYSLVGSVFPAAANSFPSACSWTNGTPIATASSTATAIYVTGVSNGFQL